ncbi:MAG: hypothetical protein Q8N59_00620 [bacterium]|nr:hypothetical protein [bacterium]
MENNNEKPHFDKLVGLSKEQRPYQEEAEKIVSQEFVGYGGKPIEKFETKKTEKDIEIIDFVKNTIGEYTEKYTKKKFDIPLENIHIFNPGGVEEHTEKQSVKGGASLYFGRIIIDRVKSDAEFARILFHELLHLNSYTAIQLTRATNSEKSHPDRYRSGVEVKTRDGKNIFFRDIEEAIIELVTQKFQDEKIAASQLFSEEDRKNIPLHRVEEGIKLTALIDVLWERNKDRFKNREEVEKLFLDAQFTGNLLKIGRLIEKTFGKGSFRKLGEGNLIKPES